MKNKNKKAYHETAYLLFGIIIILSCLVTSVNADTLSDMNADLNSSIEIRDDLSEQGFSVVRITDLIEQANISISTGDYSAARSFLDEISALEELILQLDSEFTSFVASLRWAEGQEEDRSFDTVMIRIGYEDALAEFNIGSYEEAQSLLEQAKTELNVLVESVYVFILDQLDVLKGVSIEQGLGTSNILSLKNAYDSTLADNDIAALVFLAQQTTALNTSLTQLRAINALIAEFSQNDFSTARFEEAYDTAKEDFELGNYEEIDVSFARLRVLRDDAFKAKDLMDMAEQKIVQLEDADIDASEAKALLVSANTEFGFENYGEARSIAQQSFTLAEELMAQHLVEQGIVRGSRFNLKFILRNYWQYLLTVVVVVIVAILLLKLVFAFSILKARIRGLKKEKKLIVEQIKETQRDYFIDRNISRETYDVIIDKYQQRIIEIEEKLPVLQGKFNKIKKSRKKKENFEDKKENKKEDKEK